MAKINAKDAGVRVDGLDKLRRDLKAVDAAAPRELSAAAREVAKFVADDARSRAGGLGGVAAHVAPSVKGSGTTTGAAVTLGGASYPMAAGAEFGGRGRPTTQQFQPHRGTEGYFVYPSIRANADRIEEEYTDAINDLMRKYDL